jgi:hypothetical protein
MNSSSQKLILRRGKLNLIESLIKQKRLSEANDVYVQYFVDGLIEPEIFDRVAAAVKEINVFRKLLAIKPYVKSNNGTQAKPTVPTAPQKRTIDSAAAAAAAEAKIASNLAAAEERRKAARAYMMEKRAIAKAAIEERKSATTVTVAILSEEERALAEAQMEEERLIAIRDSLSEKWDTLLDDEEAEKKRGRYANFRAEDACAKLVLLEKDLRTSDCRDRYIELAESFEMNGRTMKESTKESNEAFKRAKEIAAEGRKVRIAFWEAKKAVEAANTKKMELLNAIEGKKKLAEEPKQDETEKGEEAPCDQPIATEAKETRCDQAIETEARAIVTRCDQAIGTGELCETRCDQAIDTEEEIVAPTLVKSVSREGIRPISVSESRRNLRPKSAAPCGARRVSEARTEKRTPIKKRKMPSYMKYMDKNYSYAHKIFFTGDEMKKRNNEENSLTLSLKRAKRVYGASMLN